MMITIIITTLLTFITTTILYYFLFKYIVANVKLNIFDHVEREIKESRLEIDGEGKAHCYNEDKTLEQLRRLYNGRHYNKGFNPDDDVQLSSDMEDDGVIESEQDIDEMFLEAVGYVPSSDSTAVNDKKGFNPDVSKNDVNQYKQDYHKLTEAIAREGYTVVEDMDFNNKITQFNKLIKPSKGFNPETLEFDGVKIKEGDRISFGYVEDCIVINNESILCIRIALDSALDASSDIVFVPIKLLNITKHYPAKDKELERLEQNVLDCKNKLFNGEHQNHREYEDCAEAFDANISDYEKAQKALDQYLESKNK